MPVTGCRYFSGYKPCGRFSVCDTQCPHKDVPDQRILIVHLGALGAVVRSTSLLQAIKRKYPSSHLTWVTDRPADQLLRGNPWVDRVLVTETSDLLQLRALHFDVGFCIDKSLKAAGVIASTHIRELFGFRADAETSAIVPANSAAEELWHLGLSNHNKFFEQIFISILF